MNDHGGGPPPLTVAQCCFSRSWGGLEMTVLHLAEAMAGLGLRSDVLCRAQTPLAAACARARLPHTPFATRDYLAPRALVDLRRYLARARPDVLHAHRGTDLWLLRQARLGRGGAPPLVWTSHILFRRLKKRGPHYRWLYGGVARVIALNELARRHLLTCLPLRPEQLVIIPDGVDLERFAAGSEELSRRRGAGLRAALGIDAGVPLLGVVGRLDPQKGQDDALRALAALRARHPAPQLVLAGAETAGEPGEARRLRELAAALGIAGRVHFLGHRDDVPVVLAALDLFLMPSHAETFGYVLLEAMAAGVPVIATDAGGPPEVLDGGRAGRLVPPRDPPRLAAAAGALLDDPAAARALAAAARRRVEQRYARRVVMERTVALYRSLQSPGRTLTAASRRA